MDLVWIVPSMLVLLLLKGFFSGSEIALVNADKIKLGYAAKQGRRGARLVVELFRHPERLLTTTLVGTNLATVSLTTLGTLVMIDLFGNELGDLYAFLIYTPLFLVLGEIVPKAIYQEKADEISPIVVFPLRFFSWLFGPVVFLFASVARFAARRVGRSDATDSLFATREQFRALAEMAERASETEVFDRFRIERAARFPDTTVGETMVPIGEMVAIDREAPIDEAIRIVRRTGHTHLPVYDGNSSNVIGTLTLSPWDLLDPALGTRSVDDLVQPTVYVSRDQTLEEITPLLRDRADRMALVVDEFGSASGIITLEDVVETVVGPIEAGYTAETPLARERGRYEVLGEDRYRMDGRLSISEANDVLGVDLPTREFYTVGGLITSRLRRLARQGDSVVEAGYRFTVEDATERTIKRVRVEPERTRARHEDRQL
jgi:CBS domain containing-hemolysin-like protein